MADIHILRRSVNKLEGSSDFNVDIVAHIPITTPIANVIPTPISVLSNVETIEQIALANGSLYELATTITIQKGDTQPIIVQRLREAWTRYKNNYNADYQKEYQFYGQTIIV